MLCCTLSTSLLTILFTLVRTMLLMIDELTRPEHVVGTAQINLVTILFTVDKSTRHENVVGTARTHVCTTGVEFNQKHEHYYAASLGQYFQAS